ncbi:MAG: GxxExxY protein [Candidatus Omnitrophota bacterium]
MDAKVSRKHGEFLYGDLTDKIIELAVKIHKKLGPGFIERIYEKALLYELKNADIEFKNQNIVKVRYDNTELGEQRVDFILEDKVIIELKCVAELNEIHTAQLLSYLKTADKKVGLILNFSKSKLEIKRVMN